MYQPLHPIAIILADLWNRPHSSEALTSRLLMDRVFSLLGPDGGVMTEADNSSTRRHLSTGGKKAWSVLYKMKRNAWLKAGLDPDVIWAAEPPQRQHTPVVYRTRDIQEGPAVELPPPSAIERPQVAPYNLSEHPLATGPPAPYLENLKLYDFNQTGGFGPPGYQSAEQQRPRRTEVFQDLDTIEIGSSLSEFAALMNGNGLDWQDWDFTASGNDYNVNNPLLG